MRRDRGPEKGVILLRGTVDKPTICILIGLSTMLMLLFIRSIYRMIELSGGWSGTVISTQWLFGSSALPLPFVTKELMKVKQTCLMVPWLFRRCLRSISSILVCCFGNRTKIKRILVRWRITKTRVPSHRWPPCYYTEKNWWFIARWILVYCNNYWWLLIRTACHATARFAIRHAQRNEMVQIGHSSGSQDKTLAIHWLYINIQLGYRERHVGQKKESVSIRWCYLCIPISYCTTSPISSIID